MRQAMNWFAAPALALGLAAIALAQTGGTSGQTQAQSGTETQMKDPKLETTAGAQAEAKAEAKTEVSAETRKRLDSIKEKGAKVSAGTRAKTEAKLQATASKVNDAAHKDGDAAMAGRLSAECGSTTDHLMAEKSASGCSWGSLLLAYTLSANSKMDVTPEELVQLNNEGTEWSQIAAGLELKPSACTSAFETESKVAAGTAKPDGKVAVIQGLGARVGLDGKVGAGVSTAGLDVGAHTGVGVGVRIKP